MVVLFSVVSVCDFVCLSVNTITPEPLVTLSRNFLGVILWSKGLTSSKMVIGVARVVNCLFFLGLDKVYGIGLCLSLLALLNIYTYTTIEQ